MTLPDFTSPRNTAALDQMTAAARDIVPQLVTTVRDMLTVRTRGEVLGLLTMHLVTEMQHSGLAGMAADCLLRLAEQGTARPGHEPGE